MIDFKPKHITSLLNDLKERFPLPRDFAERSTDTADALLQRIRNGREGFETMSISDFNLIYQISRLSTDHEYTQLFHAFKKRITPFIFEIGWFFCQLNPDDTRSVELFTVSCEWMNKNKPSLYNKSLPGRAGLPWHNLYINSMDVFNSEKLPFNEFCKKFHIIAGSPFHDRLFLTYLSRCQKEELMANEEALADLITLSGTEYIRPALRNYTANFTFDEINPLIIKAMVNRLYKEPSDISLGISPALLSHIRQSMFDDILNEHTLHNDLKLNLYRHMSGRIIKADSLGNGFYYLDFGSYVVLDKSSWVDHAYLYPAELYSDLLSKWTDEGKPENFWPGVENRKIINARDAVLGIHKGGVIKIGFCSFDMLYARDILSNPRIIG